MPNIRIALPLLLILALTSCSRLDLAYRNLDRLTLWWLDDYLDLTSTQKRWLEPQIQADLQWHCRTQLPAYVDWFGEQQRLLALGPLQPEEIEAQFSVLNHASRAIAERITPSSVELLRGLSAEQMENLDQRLEKDIQKLHEEYLEPPAQKQIATRVKRMEKRLRPWFGSLSDAQQARVQEWAAQTNATTPIWIDNRQRWRDAFMAAVDTRAAKDFPQRLSNLIQQRDSLWTPAYRESFPDMQRKLAELLADLLNGASDSQRAHLLTRLGALRDKIHSLDCQG
ncbi:DUF6279 family lipoprotein [Pseudomonas sp. LS44]|uniref:DUF6279 family lipoprotein n=1 Tax=Pseudomonas sp. LS44 TaxID=1357074 RepID=UPI00215AF04D|nr:DUF6279 family lipoprotein [Pseudomonas sp. LS44]UVE18768.1 DUF6279 family lipoprotein [Pseudomonas sp. LS44]